MKFFWFFLFTKRTIPSNIYKAIPMPLRVFLTHSPAMFANFYGDRALAALRAHADVRLNTTGTVLDTPEALVRAAGDAQVLVADRATPIAAAVFPAMPHLFAACRVAVDISTIDVPAASAAGVLVTRATPGFVTAVTELALGMLVDLARGVSTAVAAYRAGHAPSLARGRQLHGATLGIVGFGVIGQRLADLALAFGMRVIVADPYQRQPRDGIRHTTLPDLLAEADYVVCLALSTPETANLFDAAAFAAMPTGSHFVNVARGEIAVEADVIAALASGKLAGAYLDVFEREPLDAASPLWDMPNVLVSPHTASHSLGQNEAIFDIFLDNLARWRAGQGLRNDVDNLG